MVLMFKMVCHCGILAYNFNYILKSHLFSCNSTQFILGTIELMVQ